jgi:alpha-tubulin suppressor-like RCC1 family protein
MAGALHEDFSRRRSPPEYEFAMHRTTTSRPAPVLLTAGVAAVSAGFQHMLFTKADGALYGTGDNTYGQLGDGTTTSRATPAVAMTGVKSAIAAGIRPSC